MSRDVLNFVLPDLKVCFRGFLHRFHVLIPNIHYSSTHSDFFFHLLIMVFLVSNFYIFHIMPIVSVVLAV
jgi:hypothetical protein